MDTDNFKLSKIKEKINDVKVYILQNKKYSILLVAIFALFLFVLFLSINIFFAPRKFPTDSILTINSGDSLQKITDQLHDQGVIRSKFFFRSYIILMGGEKGVIAGDYLLSKKQGTIPLAHRFVDGIFDLKDVRITIPEGWNVFQIADYLDTVLVKFDKDEFLKIAILEEGYLFPDTYFVSPTIREKNLIDIMKKNFEEKVLKLEELSDSDKTLDEIIKMASILEGEARPKDRALVSGILWKRISIDMPLQVDTSFVYINGKTTFQLSLDDLRIDSPYNSYRYKGLPPTPISNPGLDSILAALNPEETNYLYFLTGKDGKMYYGKTFEEHRRNRQLHM